VAETVEEVQAIMLQEGEKLQQSLVADETDEIHVLFC